MATYIKTRKAYISQGKTFHRFLHAVYSKLMQKKNCGCRNCIRDS